MPSSCSHRPASSLVAVATCTYLSVALQDQVNTRAYPQLEPVRQIMAVKHIFEPTTLLVQVHAG